MKREEKLQKDILNQVDILAKDAEYRVSLKQVINQLFDNYTTPPPQSAEEFLKGCEHDGSFIPVNEVIRLMEAYASQQKQPPQSAEELKKEFFREHTAKFGSEFSPPRVITTPYDLWKWIEKKIYANQQKELRCKDEIVIKKIIFPK